MRLRAGPPARRPFRSDRVITSHRVRGWPSRSPVAPAAQTEVVIITGLSGSGKGTVLKAFEDLGYYSVDNLPIDLIPKFAELTKDAPNVRRAALVVDIREGVALERLPALFKKIRRQIPTRLLFLEADDAALIRRFSETRRPHPLGTGAKRRGEHPQRARAAGADPRAGRSDHQHHQVQRP